MSLPATKAYPLEEAASRLSNVFSNTVTVNDVLECAEEGEIRLSVYLNHQKAHLCHWACTFSYLEDIQHLFHHVIALPKQKNEAHVVTPETSSTHNKKLHHSDGELHVSGALIKLDGLFYLYGEETKRHLRRLRLGLSLSCGSQDSLGGLDDKTLGGIWHVESPTSDIYALYDSSKHDSELYRDIKKHLKQKSQETKEKRDAAERMLKHAKQIKGTWYDYPNPIYPELESLFVRPSELDRFIALHSDTTSDKHVSKEVEFSYIQIIGLLAKTVADIGGNKYGSPNSPNVNQIIKRLHKFLPKDTSGKADRTLHGKITKGLESLKE